jgi:putative flavoprotein involved in K+ transport
MSDSHAAAPLIRTKWEDLLATGVRRGRPVLEDGREPDVANVVWCTGFRPDFSWIKLPVFGPAGDPLHERGVVKGERGLYFVGLNFLYAMSSTMIHGVGRDARYVAERLAARRSVGDPLAQAPQGDAAPAPIGLRPRQRAMPV